MEYKQALLLYAKKIADEGFRAKGEELIKELFGPVYWYAIGFIFVVSLYLRVHRRPGRDDGWCPTIISIPKRDLLKDVLSVFGKTCSGLRGVDAVSKLVFALYSSE